MKRKILSLFLAFFTIGCNPSPDMKETWNRLEAWLNEHAESISKALNTGATSLQIELLEKKIGKTLPEDFIAFYKIHNGQNDRSLGLYDGEIVLSIDRIIGEWSVWDELLQSGDFATYTSSPESGIKNNWWNPYWIPITSDGNGNHYCLDLDPSSNGKYGQVIRMWHDDPMRELLAHSFTDWINAYISDLENGLYVYSEDAGGIVEKSYAEETESFYREKDGAFERIPQDILEKHNIPAINYLNGKSCHSDIIEPLDAILKKKPNVQFFCPKPEQFAYCLWYYEDTIFAFAEGMQYVSFLLPNLSIKERETLNLVKHPYIDNDWYNLKWNSSNLKQVAEKALDSARG